MNTIPDVSHNTSLLLFALIAIVALVVLIARFKLHPFLGLMLVSVAIGFHSGMKLPVIAKTFQEGVGNTLGFLGVVVGLGMMLGIATDFQSSCLMPKATRTFSEKGEFG